MTNLNPLVLILALHFGLILAYLGICLLTGRTCLRREHLFPIVLIPIFGLLIGLGILISQWAGRTNKQSVDMEDMHLGGDIYWRSLQKPQKNIEVVPLEEAIHLDDFSIRRRILLNALFADPYKHIQVLMVARHNEDAETAHYAATTIEKIQRDFQMEIQRYAAYLKQHPNDMQILTAYISVLEKYIHSGLLGKQMVERQRRILQQLLDQKLLNHPNDKPMLLKKLRNNLALKEYGSCLEISHKLVTGWPSDEDSWIESLRTSVEAKDQMLFDEVVAGIENSDIVWSKQGRDQMQYWLEGSSF